MQQFHDDKAERAVLSCLISNPEGVRVLGGELAPDLFFVPENRAIFSSIAALAMDHAPVALQTVTRHLIDSGSIDLAGGVGYVTALQFECESVLIASHCMLSLWGCYQRREEHQIAKDLTAGHLTGPEAATALQQLEARARRPGANGVLPLWELDDLLRYEPDETEEIWPGGILSKGERTAIVGAPGIGKSRLALQASICTLLGWHFLGWQTKGQGLKWLFLQTENSARRLKADLTAMTSHLPIAQKDVLRANIRILNISALDFATICMVEGHSDRVEILATLEKWQPDVVVIDPLRDAGAGDPNKDADMTETCKGIDSCMRRSNPRRVPLVIHHGRTGAVEASRVFGDDAASFARNSKVLYGWTRSQINVAPAGADWPDTVIFGCGKNNNGPRWEPFAAKLEIQTMTYKRLEDFNLEAWEEKMGSEKRKKRGIPSPEQVAEVLKNAGGEAIGGKNDPKGLVSLVMATGIPRTDAQTGVESALGKTIMMVEIPRGGHGGGSYVRKYILNNDTKFESK